MQNATRTPHHTADRSGQYFDHVHTNARVFPDTRLCRPSAQVVALDFTPTGCDVAGAAQYNCTHRTSAGVCNRISCWHIPHSICCALVRLEATFVRIKRAHLRAINPHRTRISIDSTNGTKPYRPAANKLPKRLGVYCVCVC